MAKENNKDRILKLLKECKNHQTAESIAVQLNIQRNTASGILNELVREGIVQKEKTRPVIFSYIQPEDQLPEDPFTTFIGADQSLKDAVEKCKRMTGMVNDLLDLARIESGQYELKLEPFDLNELAFRG